MGMTGLSSFTQGSSGMNHGAPESRRKRCVPVVAKVLLGECGLIIASFRDHIELLDRVDFH